VLLIDDDEDTRALLRLVLERAGHAVLEAGGGIDGQQKALAERPDCVVMDIGLPDRNGYEIAAAIRRVDPGRAIGLVALTGHASDDDRARARHAGFDAHLTKPIDLGVVVATIAQWTGRSER
jgi:CheY-like chemotaxis protein